MKGGEGLGIITAAIFLAGEMAGSGVLALPSAVDKMGIPGLVLICLFSLNGGYIGSRLGKCWDILAQTHDELNAESVGDPYPLLAEKAGAIVGPKLSKFLRVLCIACVICTLYGASIVFMELIAGFLFDLTGSLNFCLWLVITASVLVPVTWLGTPKDFWPIAIGALVTTSIACVIVMVEFPREAQDGTVPNCTGKPFHVQHTEPTVLGYFESFGTIMFSFGGAGIFPSIQADMADRSKFKYSAVLALACLFCIYFTTSCVGYFVLGSCVNVNMLESLEEGPMKTTAIVVLMIHLVSATPIALSPPNQYMEKVFNLPKEFGWKRVVFRTAMLCFLAFIALSVPSFGPILGLIGGSTVTLLTFVLPPSLYLLCSRSDPSRKLSIFETCYCCFLILLGLAGGISSTYAALNDIIKKDFQTPCYLQF